jgi:CRP-like cAMP-binding protein
MVVIFIEHARIGMTIGKDIVSSSGAKLLRVGTVLTKSYISMLLKHDVRQIEVDDSHGILSANNDLNSDQIMNREEEVLKRILIKIPLFSKFNNKQMELLMGNINIQRAKAQTILFRENEPGDTFFAILQGSIKIYTRSGEGLEKILSVYKSGDSFGELSLIDGKPRSASAQTLESTEMIVISRENLIHVMQTHFDLAHNIMMDLAQRIMDSQQHIEELTLFDPHTRVIKSLIKLTLRFGKRAAHSIAVHMPLELNELAQMAGVKVNELQDVLLELEKQQFLKMKHNYFELNLIKLRNGSR